MSTPHSANDRARPDGYDCRMTQTYTGGCQCGRVRYRFALATPEAYLCHCRMCQRATGGFAAALVNVPSSGFEWLSPPDWYASSPIARRPFCAACGTPLGFCYNDTEADDALDVTLGSLDDPAAFRPVGHFGVESLMDPWLDTSTLPRKRSDDSAALVTRWRTATGRGVPE